MSTCCSKCVVDITVTKFLPAKMSSEAHREGRGPSSILKERHYSDTHEHQTCEHLESRRPQATSQRKNLPVSGLVLSTSHGRDSDGATFEQSPARSGRVAVKAGQRM